MAIYLGNTPIAENVTIQQGGGVTIDNALSDTSKNPVQNKVINAALNNKANLSDIPTTLPANGGNADTSNSVKTTVLIGTAENCAYSSILDWANNTSSNAWACVISAYGFPTDAPTQNEAIVSLECDTTTARKYVEWKVYAGDQHKVLRRCIYGTNWNGDWFNVADGGNADTVDGKHASDFASTDDNYWLYTFSEAGNKHGAAHRLYAKYNIKNDSRFYLQDEDSHHVRVNYADEADTLDGKHAKEFMSGYTYVVDSDQALLDWANNVGGNDYTHVLVKRGTWKMSEQVPGINLTQAGTKTVTGEPGNKIIVKYGLNYDFATLGDLTVYGLYYESAPNEDDYFVDGINIDVSQTAASTQTSTLASTNHFVQGFVNIKNLKNSIVAVYNSFPVTSKNKTYGCVGCSNIDNVAVYIKVYPSSTPNSFAYGFSGCKYLNNCLVKQITTNGSSLEFGDNVIYGCANCDYILNSNIETKGTNNACGITNCNYITNTSVRAINVKSSGATAISSSLYVSNCSIYSSSSSAHTITSSGYISNCHISATAGGGGTLVRGCHNITNTKVEVTGAGTSGMSGCTKVYGCHVAVPLSNVGNTAYSNSFASSAGTAEYACADTPNGGWNTTEDTSKT